MSDVQRFVRDVCLVIAWSMLTLGLMLFSAYGAWVALHTPERDPSGWMFACIVLLLLWGSGAGLIVYNPFMCYRCRKDLRS